MIYLLEIAPVDRNFYGLVVVFITLAAVLVTLWKKTKWWRVTNIKEQAVIYAYHEAPLPKAIIDEEGTIIAWNASSELLFGYSEKEAIGKNITIIIREKDKAAHLEGMRRAKLTGENKLVRMPTPMIGLSKSGEEIPVELHISKHQVKEEVFYTGTMRDLREQLEKENNYLRKLNIYKRREHIEKSGSFLWNIIDDVVEATPGFLVLFDFAGNLTREGFMQCVDVVDRANVNAAILRAIDSAERCQMCFATRSRGHAKIDIHATVSPDIDNNGKVISLTGFCRKITEDERRFYKSVGCADS